MRLPLIAPADLTPEQKPLYDDMRKGIASNFNAFKVEREDGALMGPWNPWLHEPIIGGAVWELAKSSRPRQLCRRLRGSWPFSTVGSHFKAAYEL